jgi:hypothetical protein
MQATLKTLNLLYEAWGRPSEAESFKSVIAGQEPLSTSPAAFLIAAPYLNAQLIRRFVFRHLYPHS